jgi:hypothetical protein
MKPDGVGIFSNSFYPFSFSTGEDIEVKNSEIENIEMRSGSVMSVNSVSGNILLQNSSFTARKANWSRASTFYSPSDSSAPHT